MKTITIVGGGPVGCLLAVLLAKRGHSIHVVERRPDMREATVSAGRSINLALSDRGLRALELAGIADDIREIAIPMSGRMMHDVRGNQTYAPYGVGEQAINSVSRGELNKSLLTLAERNGVTISFQQRCVDVNLAAPAVTFEHMESGVLTTVTSDLLIAADGAYSAVRGRMQFLDRFNYAQSYLQHGYKELHIPAAADGGFLIEKHALHIWPRHSYMMIALPNLDGSFTCTLFFAHDGSPSFAELTTRESVAAFFNEQFPDAVAMMPTIVDDYFTNPESSLMTVKCYPWVSNNVALIGDAAHAIVPFYGQGMNCGFEDCRVLIECLDACNDDWTLALARYQELRKPNGDAIADLAIANFFEMRDKVADPVFALRKKIEAYLYATYPDRWIPLYTLVTFSHVPYATAMRMGKENDAWMDKMMTIPNIAEEWNTEGGKAALGEIVRERAPHGVDPSLIVTR